MISVKLVVAVFMLAAVLGCGDGRSANDAPPADLPTSQEPIDFTTITSKIIATSRCLECHSGSFPDKDLDLSTYASMMARNVVKPGSPELSPLYIQVSEGKMPKGGPPLSTAQVALLKRWISEGALEKIEKAEKL